MTDRVQLSTPETHPAFSMPYRISVQDVNSGNHLSNDKYLLLSEEAYRSYLLTLGISEIHIFGIESVIASAQVQFLAQGKYGDELGLKLWIIARFSKGFRIFVEISRGAEVLGRIQADRVFIDNENQRACACPQAFLELYETL